MAFMDTSDIRGKFAHAMSAMYQAEVPQYGRLIELVDAINASCLTQNPALKDSLSAAGELTRLNLERHGAIRVGTAAELGMLRRLFAVMGMHPVGYYDLSVAGVPVHSTGFRPIEEAALRRNPFRLFTSLLRLDLIEDVSLRQQAEQILAKRDIFTAGARRLVGVYEQNGGLTASQADQFVAEALETFRWHRRACVDFSTYQALHAAHPLIADIVCFLGPHINHLTPRTLDIDAAQAAMPSYGITPKARIEGPPRRTQSLLLRQTSFKALDEAVRFSDHTEGRHRARFGEIEQRGVALTRRGRALYDALIKRANGIEKRLDNAAYQRQLGAIFADFPDDDVELRERGLAFYRYRALDKPIPQGVACDDVAALVAAGCLGADPITYEDFLPVSAAGIFRSNLGDADGKHAGGAAQRQQLTAALGVEPLDEIALYDAASRRSLRHALEQFQR